jgi:hypothetical protein
MRLTNSGPRITRRGRPALLAIVLSLLAEQALAQQAGRPVIISGPPSARHSAPIIVGPPPVYARGTSPTFAREAAGFSYQAGFAPQVVPNFSPYYGTGAGGPSLFGTGPYQPYGAVLYGSTYPGYGFSYGVTPYVGYGYGYPGNPFSFGRVGVGYPGGLPGYYTGPPFSAGYYYR